MTRAIVLAWLWGVLAWGCTAERLIEPAVQPALAESQAPVVPATNPQRFRQAYDQLLREEYEPALAGFMLLSTTYPQLMDYHLYGIGFIQARRGDPPAARAALTRLLAEYPQSVKSDEASLELGRLLLREGEYQVAATFLERAAASEQARARNSARLALAELAEKRGDYARAYRDLMALRRQARGSAAAREAKKGVARLRQRYRQLEPTGSELMQEAKLLLDERDYTAAVLVLQRLAASPPAGVDPVAVARLEAEALLGRGRVEEGLAVLWKVADDHPRASAAPAALFRLASLLWNRNRDAAALRAFDDLRTRYPRDERVVDATYAIARIHASAGREAEAIETFGEVVRRFPRSDLAVESKWRVGWIHYRAGRWEEAAIAFAQLAESSSGKRRDEAMYWRARAHENAGRSDRARQLYREIVASGGDSPYAAYYGAWSQARLQVLSRQADAARPFASDGEELIAAPSPAEPVAPPPLPAFHVERWRELRAAGINELARRELEAIEHDGAAVDPAAAKFLIDAYQSVDDFRRARALASRAGRTIRLSAREQRQLLYPLGFWNEVSREAKTRHIDPIWVISLMRQESMFDPEAISSAGARGLMQLLPSTAERVAGEMGSQLRDDSELFRPELNVTLGTAYLRSLKDRFDRDMLKALAAYNGGETAVERWQQEFGALAVDEFVESITYRETRDYVKRVAGNYRVYRDLYGGGER